MPPKKSNFTYSINPELYARSHKPASTIAMGMKGSQASSLCWANQVQREKAIRESWAAKYDPEDKLETEALQALERTQERDAARHEAYISPANNPDIHALLYKKAPTVPCSGEGQNTAEPSSSSSDPLAVSVNKASNRRVKRAAAVYLKARCDHYTLQQRYPDGPATAAQAVGWGAATAAVTAGASSIATARTAPLRRPAGAYRKPEDEEHAALLGFDYTPK
jgi:hypothetical protein